MKRKSLKCEILFVCQINDNNIGDKLSSPLQYFRQQFPMGRQLPIHSGSSRRDRLLRGISYLPDLIRAKMVVVGGGGLLGQEFFREDLKFWSSVPFCTKVLWGAGHNSHDIYAVAESDPVAADYAQVSRFDSAGVRDWRSDLNWVPCASCMHSELSQPASGEGGIVAAIHRDTRTSDGFMRKLLGGTTEQVDLIFNDASTEVFFGKLRAARQVVTNSFHAAYWATLLGKPTVAIGGGSKMRLMKHRPVYATVETWYQKFDEAACHPHALEECRDRNVDYCKQITERYL